MIPVYTGTIMRHLHAPTPLSASEFNADEEAKTFLVCAGSSSGLLRTRLQARWGMNVPHFRDMFIL